MKTKHIIVGTGFRGFCDALHLIDAGETEICMLDTAPFFGGVLRSFKFDSFYVDKGVHIFSACPPSLANRISEIMEGKVKQIYESSSSALNGKITSDFALPDLSSLETPTITEQIRTELFQLAKDRPSLNDQENLLQVFQRRYGRTAGNIFDRLFKNIYMIGSENVEESALPRTPMGRLKFLDDHDMLKLKKDPWLDEVLAVSRKKNNPTNDSTSLYPESPKAMAGWCKAARRWLENKGVKIHLGIMIQRIVEGANKITIKTNKGEYETNYLVWSNEQLDPLGHALGRSDNIDKLIHGTDLVLYTLITAASNINEMTYVQNFEEDALAFRISAGGPFSNQINKDGSSFIVCECPTTPNEDSWKHPEKYLARIWSECKELGVVSRDAELGNYDIKCVPNCYKLPLVGYSEAKSSFFSQLSATFSRIRVRDVSPFFRKDIYLDKKHLEGIVA